MTPSCLIYAAVLLGGAAALSAASSADQSGNCNTELEQGRVAYERDCAGCHLPNLGGSGLSPALAGEGFRSRWRGLSGSDLLKRIAGTMPLGRPGALTPAEYRAITAFVLKENQVEGVNHSGMDDAALAKIIIK